jgi:hypothetical protein
MNPNRRSVLKGIAGGTALLVGATGTGVAGEEANVRVAHASPDAPNVDVFVDGDKVLADVPFTTVSGYLELPADEYTVAIAAASDATSPDEAETVVFEGEIELDAEEYTIAAIGEVAELLGGDSVSGEAFRPDIFTDKLGRLNDGDGRVRVYHASPDAPAVDVRVVDDDGDTVLSLASDIEFGEAGPNNEVPAGNYDVAVFPAGGDEPVFGPAEVEVRDGEVLTVFAEGFLTSDPEFQPVLAYEEAAPFGRGPRDRPGEGPDDNPGNGKGRGKGN